MNAEQFCAKYAVDRVGTNSLKWDALQVRFGDPDLISMWVADMDFRTCDAVIQAMSERVRHGVFGYSFVPDEYYEAFFNWQEKHHGYRPKKEWVRFSTGVVAALYWFVNAFTKPGDSVIILTPVYYPFHNAVKDNGRRLVTCELVNTDGYYTIDYEKFEKDIVDNQIKLFIQCSPHNPAGRVWAEEELDTVLDICKRHNVLVVSDEIHQDIILGNKKQIPSAIVKNGKYADNLITVTAPSKTFNLAGLPNSHIMIENPEILARYDNYVKTVNQTGLNIFGLTAAQTAYTHGEEWLSGALAVIKQNYEYIRDALAAGAPKIVVTPLEGTYLMWLDMRPYLDPDKVKDFTQNKCRLAVDYGEWFSAECKGFIRLNLATEPKYVKAAVENIIKNIQVL